MNKAILSFLIAPLFLYAGCSFYCSGTKLFVGVAIAMPGDTLSIYADNKLIATKSVNEIIVTSLRDKRNRVAEICATKDSILIRIFYNFKDSSQHIPSKDTSFYIHVKDINGLSIALSDTHEMNIILDKVKGGFGIYEPDSR
ncbi:hypothetical protein SAMN05660461_5833 [Chitinophaga ginsengisegetis]|uniref:Uncharacterized protein n=1 Tax=Chitinophaga ginsengisegetis TaxID=393003 RepID=A0A1T5PB13_9BACT|nr:hypothetical protein [Chitinophaga ginsengisegetis]SKD09935.1 hypothetical protein SAMN05660461_5833 [Chitinophaga ginsengisegetis]